MIFFLSTAVFVGFVHSLAPGHWLPVVLIAKAQHWTLNKAIVGASIVALGHVLISLILGVSTLFLGTSFFSEYESVIEKNSGLLLMVFGFCYGLLAFFKHFKCHGHTHHIDQGHQQKGSALPFLFLFCLGLNPCIAALPLFVLASAQGIFSVFVVVLFFIIGVFSSVIGTTVLALKVGSEKVDQLLFEHYGDVITGMGMVCIGMLLYFFGF